MAEYSAATMTLSTPSGTITFNAGSGDTFLNDPTSCSGLDQAPLRTPIDDKPQTDGGIVHPFFKGARHVTLGGLLLVRSASTEAAFTTARNTLEENLRVALDSIERADGTFSWTPTGLSSRTLTVRCEIPANYTGGFQKNYLFGLVAANPDWS